MDILNWIYIKTQGLIKTTPSNADTDLVAIGGQVPFTTRDDGYQTYGMTIKDLSVAGDVANTGYYTVDLATTSTVAVTTQKGVIEVTMDETDTDPLPAFASAVPLIITNTDMDFTDPDKIYSQFSVYYNPAIDDTFIPYVLATGVISGANYAIFNANPAVAGANQFTGKLYLYYELYNF
jgi:hypothetical protein